MLLREELSQLRGRGYIIISNYISEAEREEIGKFIVSSRGDYYNEQNVRNRLSYPSDVSGSRVSNAYMVTTGRVRGLPAISLENNSAISNVVDDFQMMLAQVNGGNLEDIIDTRCMLNVQTYETKSKPVPVHFDGEYYTTVGDSCRLLEGVIPRYVAVYTVTNEGSGGTTVHNIESGEVIDLPSRSGDVLVFDNIRFLHSVKELSNPRSMFGLRNFDYEPFYYNQISGERVYQQCFAGYRKQLTTAEAKKKHQDFISEWVTKCDAQGIDKAKF
jgi:hypothetical protein